MTTKAKDQADEGMIELVSPHANLWVSLTTNVDDYSGLGGMRVVKRGDRIRFNRGRAKVPAAWKDDIESTRGFGSQFFYAVDPRAVVAAGGPTVVSGQLRTRTPAEVETPPMPEWDTMGPREIREALEAGMVADLQYALAYEGAKRARAQVLASLGKAIREEKGSTDDDDPPATPEADPSAAADNGGL